MPDAIARLRLIALRLPHGDADALWLLEATEIAGLGISLTAALGLHHGYEAVTRRQSRDAALSALAAASPGRSVNAKAAWIAAQLAAHRRRTGSPDRDGITEHLVTYLDCRGPTSAERVRRLLPDLLVKNALALTNDSG